LVLPDPLAPGEQLGSGLRREPPSDIAVLRCQARARLRDCVAELFLEDELVVARRLDAHEQTVERGQVAAGRVVSGLERLDERRTRPGERVEHASAARHVPREQRLDELRDELAQVGVQTVDVLRALPLGEIPLGPGEIEVDLRVKRILRALHGTCVRARSAESWTGLRSARLGDPYPET